MGGLVVKVPQHEQLLLLVGLGCGREHVLEIWPGGVRGFVAIDNVEVVNVEELEAGRCGSGGEDGARGMAVLNKSEKAASDVLSLALVALGRRERSPSAVAFAEGHASSVLGLSIGEVGLLKTDDVGGTRVELVEEKEAVVGALAVQGGPCCWARVGLNAFSDKIPHPLAPWSEPAAALFGGEAPLLLLLGGDVPDAAELLLLWAVEAPPVASAVVGVELRSSLGFPWAACGGLLAVGALPELGAVCAGKVAFALGSMLVAVSVVSKLVEMMAEPEGLAIPSK